MIKKGFVSSLSGNKARVTFPDLDGAVTAELPICDHVGTINNMDTVLVAFWDDNMTDGAIIGKVS